MSDVNVLQFSVFVVLILSIVALGTNIYRLNRKVTELRNVLQKRHQVTSMIKKNAKRAKLAGLSRPKTAAQKAIKKKKSKTAVTITTG